MTFGRVPFGKLPHPLRAGDGFVANPSVAENAVDAVFSINSAELSGGFIIQTANLTALRLFLIPDAEDISNEFPEMDIGDSFVFVVSNSQSDPFEILVGGGTDITSKGSGEVPALTSRTFVLVKTAAEAYDLF